MKTDNLFTDTKDVILEMNLNFDDLTSLHIAALRAIAENRLDFENASDRMLDVIFEFDKSRLMPRSYATLNALGEVLVKHQELSVTIEGHTDNIGSAAYNIKLSQGRAEAARTYLLEQYPGLDPGRLSAEGFGFTKPVADNANETGRALNRRVEFRVTEK